MGPHLLFVLLAYVAPVAVPLGFLSLFALVDNKRRSGWWLPYRPWKTRWQGPTPHEGLTAADKDAWLGGNGGN